MQQLLCYPPRAQATPTRAERVWCSARNVGRFVCCIRSCAGSVGPAPARLAESRHPLWAQSPVASAR